MNDETIAKNDTGFNKLADEIKSTLNYQIKKTFTSFVETADTAFFDLANEAGSNAEQKQYFELMQTLRVDKQNLVRGMITSLDEYLKPVSTTLPDYDIEVDTGDGELSLVSQDAMEEMVLINAISSKADEKFKEATGKLGLRLAYLTEHSAEVFYKDALIPLNFCKSFKEAIGILDITIADKIILYKLFDTEVISNLKSIYDLLNSILIEAEILPNVKLHASNKSTQSVAKKSTYQSEAENSSAGSAESGHEQSAGAGDGGGAGATGTGSQNSAPSNGAAGHQAGYGESAGHSENRSGSTGYYSTAENPQIAGSEGSASRAGSAASSEQKSSGKSIGGYPVERASEIIRDYIGSDSTNSASAEGNSQFYGHNDVLNAFTKMQAVAHGEIQEKSAVVARVDSSEIKQALLSTIASQQGGAITKSVDQVIEKTIDFIKLIFDAIIDDKNISDTIKALLLTLQIPVIKASMLDQNFFISDDHPARLLLDKVSEVGIGITSKKDELYQSIYEVIHKLLAEYSNDINAFVAALESIEVIIAGRAEQAEQKERQAQDGVQKVHARKIVLCELRRSTLGKKLPTILHTLILKFWPTMMFNHFLRNGKENDEWITLVTTLRELIESIQMPKSNEEHAELKINHMAVSIRVERQLNKFQKIKEQKQESVQALRDTYADLLASYVPTAGSELKPETEEQAMKASVASDEEINNALDNVSDDVAVNVSAEITEADPDEPVYQRDQLRLLPDDVKPGTWFRLTMENERVRRLKLSIIIIEEALLVFVDHNGDCVAERTAGQFAEELKNDEAHLIMNHSVFDHAMSSVFETIK